MEFPKAQPDELLVNLNKVRQDELLVTLTEEILFVTGAALVVLIMVVGCILTWAMM